MAKVKFEAEDFEKVLGQNILSDGDVQKDELKTLRVDLEWKGTDLDVCAFMLDSDGELATKDDIVYFKSKIRWKTAKPFDANDFDPLDGKKSVWAEEQEAYGGRVKVWMNETLPASPDGSVIGSWDDMTEDPDAPCGETMHIMIEEINTIKYKRIALAAVVAEDLIKEGITFKEVRDASVTITDVENEDELVSYPLSEKFPDKDAVCFGELVYDEDNYQWNFKPMASGYKGGILYLANNVF